MASGLRPAPGKWGCKSTATWDCHVGTGQMPQALWLRGQLACWRNTWMRPGPHRRFQELMGCPATVGQPPPSPSVCNMGPHPVQAGVPTEMEAGSASKTNWDCPERGQGPRPNHTTQGCGADSSVPVGRRCQKGHPGPHSRMQASPGGAVRAAAPALGAWRTHSSAAIMQSTHRSPLKLTRAVCEGFV